MRSALRVAFRLSRVGLHLAWAVGVAAFAYPLIGHEARLRLKQRWSRQLLVLLGIRLEAARPAPPRGLLVANHISWLDIYVINALSPAAFVCKAEVRAWPIIGWLCARTDTVFIERGSSSAARRANEALAARLAGGVAVVFPEGTTSDGARLLPFRSALLQAAIDSGSIVQPLALSYLDASGRRTPVAAYCGDTTLWQSLRVIAGARGLSVRVEILPPLATQERTRRELAEAAHGHIGAVLARLTFADSPGCADEQPAADAAPACP